jgi:hypothetical protein
LFDLLVEGSNDHWDGHVSLIWREDLQKICEERWCERKFLFCVTSHFPNPLLQPFCILHLIHYIKTCMFQLKKSMWYIFG